GFIDPSELESLLKAYNTDNKHGLKRIRLITISAASNVLGACNDLQAIGEMAKRYGVQLMVDAAQLIAHRPVDMKAWNIDCLAFSAHKVYAPFGCGVLILKKGMLNMKQEEMEQINTLGDENAGGIAALGKALLLLRNIGYDQIDAEEKQLTVKALQKLATIKNLKVFGIDDPDSPRFDRKIGVIVFDLKNKMAGRIADKLAHNKGIGIRYGCHCAHLIIKHLLDFTPFQEKFQRFVLKLIPIINLQGIARVSVGIQNTETDLDPLIEELNSISGNGQQTTDVQFTKKETLRQINEFINKRELFVFGQQV
ncbi:MAG: aminotransferase class V-fold PLP-dependent enzyme, partial [Bacteroidales bacterium]|nr:aminotransferase class V-fold PLP-dependent enzyme [Bacteroidales bacterium]